MKSIARVVKFGEVNTSPREVNAMLDLVKSETERFDSRFLEPACGDGNFLLAVLDRKLDILAKQFSKNQYEFEKNGVVVISSIYGIDILEDNIKLAIQRLFDKFMSVYEKQFHKSLNQKLIQSVKFILGKNIIHADALTLKNVDSNEPIIFCEWSMISNKIKRRDFALSTLLDYAPFGKGSLFSDLGQNVFIPDPIREYPPINFYEVSSHDEYS